MEGSCNRVYMGIGTLGFENFEAVKRGFTILIFPGKSCDFDLDGLTLCIFRLLKLFIDCPSVEYCLSPNTLH